MVVSALARGVGWMVVSALAREAVNPQQQEQVYWSELRHLRLDIL